MAGGKASFDRAIPMNAIGFMGLHIITAGTYDGETYVRRDGENYKILFYKDDVLKGYILIGDVARAGIYTALIRNRTPLSSIDFKLICEKPQLMAFTARTRRDLLSNALGQRYIGAGQSEGTIILNEVPGNALGAYLDGANIIVNCSAQDATGDTMNAGEITIHGSTGDAAGYAMRGGAIYVQGDAGYRAGIHMQNPYKQLYVTN